MRDWQLSPAANVEQAGLCQVSHYTHPFLRICMTGVLLTGDIIVEEGVMTGAIDKNVRGAENPQAPCHGAVARDTTAVGAEVGIV